MRVSPKMQIGVKRVTLIFLAVVVWFFNIVVWLSAISAGLAWLLSTWKPELTSAFPVASQLRSWADASLFDFAPLFELLVLAATALTTPFAIWVWRKATTISVETATSTQPDVKEVETGTATASRHDAPDDKAKALAKAKPSAAQLSRHRELLLTASRLEYISGVEFLLTTRSSLSWIGGYGETDWNIRTSSSRRPYFVEVKKPNEPSIVLSATSSMIDVVRNTKGWRIITLGTKAYTFSDHILALDIYKELLDKAHSNSSAPVPVSISLSQWFADENRSFEEWVLYRLHFDYKVPTDIGAYWLSSGSLVLVLDGYPDEYNNMHKWCHDALVEFWKYSIVSIVINGTSVSRFRETGGRGVSFYNFPADATMNIPEPTLFSSGSQHDQ